MSNHQNIFIARPEDVHKRVNELRHRSDDIKSRVALTLKQLWNPERQLRSVSTTCDFLGLRERFPQFSEVIDFVENVVISMGFMELPFEVPPILLLGDPGLGKTYFVSELAKLMDLPFREISMATASSSFALAGGNLQWSEGSPGSLASFIAESSAANPIVLLDELDKISSDSKYNAINVLYGWLEPHSAKRFRDEALDIDLDVSKVIWLGTGNYVNRIPEPIQSRMRVFEICQPVPAQMEKVARSIYVSIRSSKPYGQLMDETVGEEVVSVLSLLSPRSIRLSIEEGVFRVIRDHRSQLTVSDLPSIKKETRRVGFI